MSLEYRKTPIIVIPSIVGFFPFSIIGSALSICAFIIIFNVYAKSNYKFGGLDVVDDHFNMICLLSILSGSLSVFLGVYQGGIDCNSISAFDFRNLYSTDLARCFLKDSYAIYESALKTNEWGGNNLGHLLFCFDRSMLIFSLPLLIIPARLGVFIKESKIWSKVKYKSALEDNNFFRRFGVDNGYNGYMIRQIILCFLTILLLLFVIYLGFDSLENYFRGHVDQIERRRDITNENPLIYIFMFSGTFYGVIVIFYISLRWLVALLFDDKI